MVFPKSTRDATLLLFLALAAGSNVVQAHSSTFLLDYSGTVFNNSAEAHGSITFESALLPNPTVDDPSTTDINEEVAWLLPDWEVTSFSLTVTGASFGNGSFSLTDFDYFSWNTKGVELDLSRDLIGQITVNGLLWASEAGAGGFGLGAAAGSGAPTSLQWRVLVTNEGFDNASDRLALTSFRPAAVPLPPAFWLFGPALASLVTWRRSRSR